MCVYLNVCVCVYQCMCVRVCDDCCVSFVRMRVRVRVRVSVWGAGDGKGRTIQLSGCHVFNSKLDKIKFHKMR